MDFVDPHNVTRVLQNIFAARFRPFGFNIFPMFVVDMLHEFELGVWKAIFIHLIRMLVTIPGNVIQEFNHRYVFVLRRKN